MKHTWKYVIRALLGLLFTASATLKLLSIDSFEIYIFSFGLVPLEVSFLAARVVIAAEYAAGLLLVANFHSRAAWWVAFLMTLAFTGVLVYLLYVGRTDNCHCFGDFVDLSPEHSLCKNLVILLLLGLSHGCGSFSYRLKPLWTVLSVIAPLAAVFICSPPDNWYYEDYGRSTVFNEDAFRNAVSDGLMPGTLLDGERIVCFYSLKCEFCRMSAEKIAVLRRRGEFSRAPVTVIFGRGVTEASPLPFFEETGLEADGWQFIDPSLFLRITGGKMPLILLLDDGKVIAKYSYRDIR